MVIKIGKIFHYAEFERAHVECAMHRLDLHTSNVLHFDTNSWALAINRTEKNILVCKQLVA